MPSNLTHTDIAFAKVLVALGALVGAGVAVYFSKVAYAFACDGPDPCRGFSDPVKMRTFAWIVLGGVLVSILLARFRRRTAAILTTVMTAVAFLIWLSLFIYIIEGEL